MKRQTAMASGLSVGSSREFRLDPFGLPVRYAAPAGSDGPAFVLSRHRAVVRRPARSEGPLTEAVLVADYSGVAVRIVPADEPNGLRVIVELLHSDPTLTLPLLIADEPEDAAADWQAWGRALNLPLLVIEQDGTIRAPLRRMGGLVVGRPLPRRRRSFLAGRRPRFLRRRKTGRVRAVEILSGREIIARD